MSDELNIEDKLQELDRSEELAKYYVQRAKDYEKLVTIPEFQSVIIDGYLNVEQDDVFSMLTSVYTQKQEIKDALIKRLDNIRGLKMYLGAEEYAGTIMLDKDKYTEELKDIEVKRAELMKERYSNES